MSKFLISNMIDQLKNILDGDLWIDENYKKKIDGLCEDRAFAKPSPLIFSVAELISHILALRNTANKKIIRSFGRSHRTISGLLEKQ